jgi:hypothetical protein
MNEVNFVLGKRKRECLIANEEQKAEPRRRRRRRSGKSWAEDSVRVKSKKV